MVEIGSKFECLGDLFTISKLIGKGKGGYSYLALSDTQKVVYKQMHYEPNATYQFENNKLQSELRDYQTLNNIGIMMPKLLQYDDEKQFLVKEYIDGQTISEIVAENKLEDDYIVQMFRMCQLLYANGLNIDYFPPNFVVENGRLYYIDFECNHYMAEWDFENWGIYFWANTAGWAKFQIDGDHNHLSENAKPHKAGLEYLVSNMLQRKPM